MDHDVKDKRRAALGGDPLSRATDSALQSRDDDELTHESFRSLLSTQQQAGPWEPADEIDVRAILGEVTLDFTRAELPPSGMIDIYADAILGEIHIILPRGAEIELDATPYLGGVECVDLQVRKKGTRERIREWVTGERPDELPGLSPPEEPPYFRIEGRAILGNIKVTCR